MASKPRDDKVTDKNTDPASDEDAEIDSETIPPKESARDEVLGNILADREQQLRDNGVDLDAEASGEEGEGDDDDDDAEAAADRSGEEPGDEGAAAGEEADEEDKETAGAEEGAEEEAEPAAAAAADPGQPGERMVTVIVDGKEKQVPESWLVSQYQKLEAADARMQEANQILDAAMEVQQRITTGGAGDKQPDTSGRPDPGAADPQDSERLTGLRTKAVDAIQFGSKEEGEQALGELIDEVISRSQKSGASIDIEATHRQIEQRVMDQVEWRDSVARFGKEFDDIIEQPQLRKMTADRANELFTEAVQEAQRQGRPGRPSYWSIFQQAGDETRAWVKSMRGDAKKDGDGDKPQPNPNANVDVQLSDERTKAKRTSSTTPKPRTVQKPAGAGEAKVKTPNQIRREGINDIMRSREKAA